MMTCDRCVSSPLQLILVIVVHALVIQIRASSLDSNPRPVEDENPPRLSLSGDTPDSTDCDNTEPADKQSFLWTLQRQPPTYFFGTVHVPYSRVWAHIPENVKLAFHRADNVYFELDLTDRYTVMSLANCQMLPQGEHLANIVPPALFARLRRHLATVKALMPGWMTDDQKGKGLYAEYLFNAITGGWERKRPVWVMLMVNSLTEADIRARGRPVLDLYLAKEAKRLGKLVGSVEQVDEQCVPLNHLNVSQVLFALNQTLSQHEESTSHTYTTDDLIYQYNCGQLDDILISHDTAQVPPLLLQLNGSLPSHNDLSTAQQIEDYFRAELIHKRNQRMAQRISRLLKIHPRRSFFFAFGAGHFIGNDTVLDMLRARGHHIEHTSSSDPLTMGEGEEEREYPPLLADYLSESALPAMFVNSDLETLDPLADRRSRHNHQKSGRRRGRKKERREEAQEEEQGAESQPVTDSHGIRQSNFNHLWVRLEASSDDAFHLPTLPPVTETQGQKQYILYNCAHVHTCTILWMVAFMRTLWVMLEYVIIAHY